LVEANITAFGKGHFRRDNRPKMAVPLEELEFKKKVIAKQQANMDNYFQRRAKITASIVAPAKIVALKSTETRVLLGES